VSRRVARVETGEAHAHRRGLPVRRRRLGEGWLSAVSGDQLAWCWGLIESRKTREIRRTWDIQTLVRLGYFRFLLRFLIVTGRFC
jgi:hypothetical protein